MAPTAVLSIHYKTLFKMNNKNYKNIIDNQVSKTDSEPKLYMNGYRMVSCKEVEIQDGRHCSTFLSLDPQYWKMNISIFYE